MQSLQSFTFALFALVAFALLAFASPLPTEIEKRTTHTGRGTWYEPGLGNCGYTDSSSDAVVAIGIGRYENGGNCNQYIRIENTSNGKSTYAQTRDSCQSCSTEDLDMSPAVFQQIASLDDGEITISWNFMSKEWSP